MFVILYGRDGELLTSKVSYQLEMVSAILIAPVLPDGLQF